MTDLFLVKSRTVTALGVVACMLAVPFSAQAQASAPTPLAKPQGFPTWSEFPPPPKDVPTAADIKVKVVELTGVGVSVQKTVDAIVWELDQPQAFAARTNARIDPLLGAPAKPLAPGELEAFAGKLRARATPPPVEN